MQFDRLRRREFITLLGGAASWSLAAQAQQRTIPIVGFLHSASLEARREGFAAFHRGLADAGYVEGRNVAIEYRWADGHNDRLPSLAADLVRQRVAVIAAPGSTPSALAAQAATRTIPIVFMIGTDPVQTGLVTSLNRPAGNITGISLLNLELVAKRLDLLHQLVPRANSIALLTNPANPVMSKSEIDEMRQATSNLGLHLLVAGAASPKEIAAAFTTLEQQHAGALQINGDPVFFTQINQLVELAARHSIPTMSHFREFTLAGGLSNYGPNFPAAYRQVGVYVGRILNGEKPDELPVQQSTKIDFVLNRKTANALGLEIPPTLLVFADEVIE
jgi:putative ABC transport system substrate-binding protein